MKELGTQTSTVKPKEVEIYETVVFVASNITEITKNTGFAESNQEFHGWQFDLVEYDKNEYIQLLQERNVALSTQLDDTQIALCDIYEMLI